MNVIIDKIANIMVIESKYVNFL